MECRDTRDGFSLVRLYDERVEIPSFLFEFFLILQTFTRLDGILYTTTPPFRHPRVGEWFEECTALVSSEIEYLECSPVFVCILHLSLDSYHPLASRMYAELPDIRPDPLTSELLCDSECRPRSTEKISH